MNLHQLPFWSLLVGAALVSISLIHISDNAHFGFFEAEAKIEDHTNCTHDSFASIYTEDERDFYRNNIEKAVWEKVEKISNERGIAMCWAPNTPVERIEEFYANLPDLPDGLRTGLTNNGGLATGDGGTSANFELASTPWMQTATDGAVTPGECMTLTWSIVPEGTFIDGFNGEPASGSQLIAHLDNIYGCVSGADLTQSCWFETFEMIFTVWGEKTGITYVYEPNDDGDPWSASVAPFMAPGVLGVRGDIRIAAHPVDGDFGILAYNFFPAGGAFGDMVIDCPDAFYSLPQVLANNSLGLRNVLAHEHGHGLGLAHSCPVDNTKLMEPFVTLAFDGPQEDDILGAQTMYGDRFCEDVNSFPKGEGETVVLECVSVQNAGSPDVYEFEVPEGLVCELTVVMTPTGTEYLAGPQDGSVAGDPANCSAGVPFDAGSQADLDVMVSGPGGSGTGNSNPAGAGESVTMTLTAGGTHQITVSNNGENVAQMYDLSCTFSNCIVEELDFDSGDLSFSDPCSCSDPLNCKIGEIIYFHDILEVTGAPGLTITVDAGATDFYTDTPCFGGALALVAAGTVIPEVSPGVYQLVFWRPESTLPTISVSATGVSFPVPAETFEPLCGPCLAAIPTMGQWALLGLGILFMIFGVVAIRQRSVQLR